MMLLKNRIPILLFLYWGLYQMFTIDLLDYLALKAEAPPLSELRRDIYKWKLKDILEKISLEQCSEREWLDTARYLTGRTCSTVEEARDVLLRWTDA